MGLLVATRVWARSRVPRPEFADENGLTGLGVHGAAQNARWLKPESFTTGGLLCKHATKPHQQSLRFYPDFDQYSSALAISRWKSTRIGFNGARQRRN